jgi:signal transduction histidine kinase
MLTLLMALATVLPGAIGAQDDAPLTDVSQMRALSRDQAERHPPVHLHGVVIFKWRAGFQSFDVQDGHEAIWVSVSMAKREKVWLGTEATLDAVVEGKEVEIDGVMDAGGFSPDVLPRSIRVLGDLPVPPGRRVPVERLMNGAEDSQRVEVAGVVQSCVAARNGQWLLQLETGGGKLLASMPASPTQEPGRLVDADVSLTGVAASSRNWRAEFICPRLLISSPADARIDSPAPVDPFAVPSVACKELAVFSPAGRARHRRRIAGTVTYQAPGSFLYLQDGSCAVRVGSDAADLFAPGDRIEAAGFIDTSRPVAGLEQALVRKIGTTAPPEAIRTALRDIQAAFRSVRDYGLPASPHDYDGLLVSVTGRLLEVQLDATGDGRRLVLDCGGSLTTADLAQGPQPGGLLELDALQPGSQLRLSGVAIVQYAPSDNVVDYTLPNRLDLLLRSSADVAVLQAPSWWTSQRLWIALAGTVLILCASLAWSLAMRRLLRARSKRLEEVMRLHRDSELEFRAARQERQRLAADMHDGLQQLIAGATYRLEAAAAHLEQVPPAVTEQLAAARGALLRTQEGLRDCLWGLRHVDEGSSEFPALLEHAAASMDHWPAGGVVVRAAGTPFALSRHVMGSLLMLMQEAVGNAFRHGNAAKVQVSLDYDTDRLEMRMEDDGAGFDPHSAPGTTQGHFGLESMRHRMSWLGGTVEIASSPGSGTRVCIRLPRSRARAQESSANTAAYSDEAVPPPGGEEAKRLSGH